MTTEKRTSKKRLSFFLANRPPLYPFPNCLIPSLEDETGSTHHFTADRSETSETYDMNVTGRIAERTCKCGHVVSLLRSSLRGVFAQSLKHLRLSIDADGGDRVSISIINMSCRLTLADGQLTHVDHCKERRQDVLTGHSICLPRLAF